MADSSDNINNGMTPEKYADALRGHVKRLNDLADAAHAEGLVVRYETDSKVMVGVQGSIPTISILVWKRL